eukprot:gnl/Dysnectes_brevis/1549_a1757_1959.p1 GENE.gnl/Dysnectes_brevis/1549_a1757_1959~~gnl/Dysnectes_brevis/1549_a1757_1959.p1  ORF type:complete len:587 (+),score=198.20 gnl/Dysnectes_brevis/1549_a1757_1959:80-1840(+)
MTIQIAQKTRTNFDGVTVSTTSSPVDLPPPMEDPIQITGDTQKSEVEQEGDHTTNNVPPASVQAVEQSNKTDILSGLAVSLALIPEAIAFSFVASVDPIIGLYAAFMMGFVCSIIGGRPGMVTAASGAVAVVYAPLMTEMTAEVGSEAALGYLFAALILMGLIQVTVGLLKLGCLIRLVPHPVMIGFVDGLACVILIAQLGQFYEGSGEDKQLLQGTDMWVMLIMIAFTMAICWFLPRLTKAVPATLVALILVTVISTVLDTSGIIHMRTVIDYVTDMDPTKTTLAAKLPSFAFPTIPFTTEAFLTILPYSVIAALVGLIETLLTMSRIDELTMTRGRGNKECVAQGVACILNGFFGGMGGCALLGQSVLLTKAGGRGRLSSLSAAVFLFLFVMLGTAVVEIIPLAALVGVMFVVVLSTFDFTTLRVIKSVPRADSFVILLVTVVTVVEDLAVAVLIGVVVSALAFAWDKSTRIAHTVVTSSYGTKVYHLDGAIFFGSVQSFKDIFTPREDPKEVVIDFAKSRVHDHSGIEALNWLTSTYAEQGKYLHLLNLSPECQLLLDKATSIIEVSIIEGLDSHHIASNALA